MLSLAALALLCWPPRPALRRREGTGSSLWAFRRPLHRGGKQPGRVPTGRPVWPFAVLAVGAAAVPAGPAAVCAAALIGITVGLLTSSELRRRRGSKQLARLLVATRTLGREVRTGAAPGAALLATAAAHPGCAAVFEQLAVAVSGRGGSAAGRPSRGGSRERLEQEVEVAARLGDAWQLSSRYGVPWAALIDTVATDLADRQRAESLRNAQVAGPRVSGYVLAVMPALGILLGAGMGADPVHVLLGTGLGGILLLVGSALTCLGLAWTASIVGS